MFHVKLLGRALMALGILAFFVASVMYAVRIVFNVDFSYWQATVCTALVLGIKGVLFPVFNGPQAVRVVNVKTVEMEGRD